MSNDRRKFLRNSGLAIIGVSSSGSVVAKDQDQNESTTIKMLTPEGELVEVPAIAIKKSTERTSNQDILDWRESKGE